MLFEESERDSLIGKIEELYFNKNFGSVSKADFELVLFSAYIEHLISSETDFDDYTLSKALGISQSRVRSLKERKELKYPYKDFDWRTAFAKSLEHAKYDENDHYVKVIIQDVNVMNEVRHYIEEKGWYDECSLNKKLLKISLGCLVDICDEDGGVPLELTADTKNKLKKLAKDEVEIEDLVQGYSKSELKTFLMSASEEVIFAVIDEIPFGGMARKVFMALKRAMSERQIIKERK